METPKKTQEWNVTKKEWQEEAVLDHLNCCLCGTELTLKHKTDYIHQITTEDAHCSRCGVKHRSAQHRLQ